MPNWNVASWSPATTDSWGSARCSTLHLPVLNINESLSVMFVWPFECLSERQPCTPVSAALQVLYELWTMRTCFVPLFRQLIKMLKVSAQC